MTPRPLHHDRIYHLLAPCCHGAIFNWRMHKGATIRILAPKNAAAMAIEPFIPDFEKLTGIKVQYESFPDDHFRQKILLELTAGTGGMDAFYTATSQEGLKWRDRVPLSARKNLAN